MKVIKMRVPDNLSHKLPKSEAERKEIVRLGLQHFSARGRKKSRSVVNETYAALALRKHAKIERLIDQTKYGD
jgi:hypothetical protein